jgi:hypothetical protein
MPRKRGAARLRALRPHEKAFLYNDESYLPPEHGVAWGSYRALCEGQRPLLAIHRSPEELLAIPQFKKIYEQHHEAPADAAKTD